MSRPDPSIIALAILAAPGWARVGITAPRAHLREDAADELARCILVVTQVDGGEPLPAAGQLPLSL